MKIFNLLTVISIFVFFSCSSLKVTTDFEKEADFASYKTYSIVEVDADQTGISELNLKRVYNSVNSELANKGLSQEANPDLEVHLHAIVEDKIDVDYDTQYYGTGLYGRRFGYGSFSSTVDVTEYQAGSLIIDLVDAKTKELVWQGIGTARLNEKTKGREERIQKAVVKILAGYPPGK